MVMMILAYAGLAVVLLAYVSTQVYTSSLMEDVDERVRDRQQITEEIGLLTIQYTSLVSRSRISRLCEQRLGMVQADATAMERIAIDSRRARFFEPSDFSERPLRMPEVLGANIGGISEAMRR